MSKIGVKGIAQVKEVKVGELGLKPKLFWIQRYSL